jgi:DNA polymerase III subunit delta'
MPVVAPATSVDLWAEAVGQERLAEQLRSAARQPVHAYLFLGPEGWGARAVARAFAAEVLTGGLPADEVDRIRELVAEDNFADLLTVEAEGNQLRKDEVDELIRLAFRAPTERPYKVLVVPHIDTAGPVAWSRMLKVLEEPSATTVWVLLADELPPEMATIASRSVTFRLDSVPADAVARRLEAEGVDPAAARTAALAAGGDVGLARLLADDERLALRVEAWRRIPHELDGTGHAAWRLAAEVRSTIDDAVGAMKERFAAAEVEAAAHAEERGLTKGQLRQLGESHKRQVRKARTAELRLGLAALAGAYRDALGDDGGASLTTTRRRAVLGAVVEIDAALEAFVVRNANESLQLQALFLRLPSLR